MSFTSFQFSQEILRAIEDMEYHTPTNIQAQTIPVIMEGKDVLGRSHTGTGKTAAYGLPLVEMLNPTYKMPQALIICPTRELVIQVTDELRKFSKYKEGIKCVPIFGGYPIDYQIKMLKKGCSIIIGTPGRILDHLRRKTLKLNFINHVVLDEADEMLNMGFKEDIESILEEIKQEHQTLMFSATMPKEILEIAKYYQNKPVHIEIKEKQKTVHTIDQLYFEVHKARKVDVLQVLMKVYPAKLTMIFCNTKKSVDEVSEELSKTNLPVVAIHGDMKQSVRSRVMEQFKTQQATVLVATDVAARGLDIDNVDLVINYDLPQEQEFYVHRIGRTGRIGRNGQACTLISGSKEKLQLQQLCKYIKYDIPKGELPSSGEIKEIYFEQMYQKILAQEANDKEIWNVLKALRQRGLDDNQIMYGLIAQLYQLPDLNNLEIDDSEAVRKKVFRNGTTKLQLSVGRNDGVAPNHIVAAIAEEAKISNNYIGKIEVRKTESFVEVPKDYALQIIRSMQKKTINNVPVVIKEELKKRRK